MDDLKQQLTERLQENYSDYHNHLLGFEPWALIDMAGRIAHTKEVLDYLTTERYTFREGEAEYLLRFVNPLEVVTDAWEVQRADINDLDFIMHSVCDHKDALADYPLMNSGGDRPASEKKPSIKEQLQAAKGEQARQPKPVSPAKDDDAR